MSSDLPPSIRRKRNQRKLSVPQGIGLYLLFWVLVALPFIGIVITGGGTPRPKSLGWLLIIVGISGALKWVGAWARIIPGVFAPTALNGLIMFVSGHALNQASAQVPRWESIIIIALAVTGAIVAAPFTNGNLTIEDKIGALGVWVCFVAAFVGVVLPMNGWEAPVGIALIACLAWIQIRRTKLTKATSRTAQL